MVSPYFEKCKRLRTDGPTPCLCCPGECVGDQDEFDGHPGFYSPRDYEDDSQRATMLLAVVAAFIVATCATAFVIAAVLHAKGMG